MSLQVGGRGVASMWFEGRRVASVWTGGRKVWPSSPLDAYVAHVMEDEPAAFWPGQDTSGGLIDITGNGHAAAKVGAGTVTYQADGPVDGIKAVELPGGGTTGFSVPDDDVWSSDVFTMEGVVRFAETPAGGALWAKHFSDAADEFHLVRGSQSWVCRVHNAVNAGWRDAGVSQPYQHSVWLHVAMVCAPTELRFVINGEVVGTGSGANGTRRGNGSGVLGLGWDPASETRGLSGRQCLTAFYPAEVPLERLAERAAMLGLAA